MVLHRTSMISYPAKSGRQATKTWCKMHYAEQDSPKGIDESAGSIDCAARDELEV